MQVFATVPPHQQPLLIHNDEHHHHHHHNAYGDHHMTRQKKIALIAFLAFFIIAFVFGITMFIVQASQMSSM